MATFRISHPERYWIAARDDLPSLAGGAADPGWSDRTELNWEAIAHIVADAAVQIACMETAEDDDGHWLDVDTAGLSRVEARVVESWLHPTLAPRSDPVGCEIVDGRRRLRHAWERAPRAQLLVSSDLLRMQDAITDNPLLAPVLAGLATEVLSTAAAPVLYRAPLYAAALGRLSRQRPPEAPHPSWVRGIKHVEVGTLVTAPLRGSSIYEVIRTRTRHHALQGLLQDIQTGRLAGWHYLDLLQTLDTTAVDEMT